MHPTAWRKDETAGTAPTRRCLTRLDLPELSWTSLDKGRLPGLKFGRYLLGLHLPGWDLVEEDLSSVNLRLCFGKYLNSGDRCIRDETR